MRDYRDLQVWRKAHELVLELYRHTSNFPAEERYGLKAQILRSAVSVASNIAEGCGRDSERELGRFLTIAAGSASELEYQVLLASDLNYFIAVGPADEAVGAKLLDEVAEVKKMLRAFIRALDSEANS